MSFTQQCLFDPSSVTVFPQGLRYVEQAITAEHEVDLLSQIQELPLKEFQFHGFKGKRRVSHLVVDTTTTSKTR